MITLNVIGCGNVGKTICRLWVESGTLSVRHILNRSPAGARRAAAFVGAGQGVESYSDLAPADLVWIACSDDAIESCCEKLAADGPPLNNTTVFHGSGSLSSKVLASAAAQGARIASVHPINSFADPASLVSRFAGTYCAVEGDEEALAKLRPLFEQIGCKLVEIDRDRKAIYHAGAVFACNYLMSLMDVAVRCYQAAGISESVAREMIEPMVRATVDNFFRQGAANSLTGPIARGEVGVVRQQHETVRRWNEPIGELYRRLGLVAVDLSRRQGNAPKESLDAIEQILSEENASGKRK